jgi:hypothetical protein
VLRPFRLRTKAHFPLKFWAPKFEIQTVIGTGRGEEAKIVIQFRVSRASRQWAVRWAKLRACKECWWDSWEARKREWNNRIKPEWIINSSIWAEEMTWDCRVAIWTVWFTVPYNKWKYRETPLHWQWPHRKKGCRTVTVYGT